MVDPDIQPLVLDNGSGMMKVGFGGDDAPRNVFPNIHGVPKNPGIGTCFFDSKMEFIGDEAQAKRGILKLRYPIPIDGTPPNNKFMNDMWHHTFYNELRVTPEEHPVLLTDTRRMSENFQKKIVETMFEDFNVPALGLCNPGVLSLYATGRTTGIVVDSGFGGTSIVPCYEGYPINHICVDMENPVNPLQEGIGGSITTSYLVNILCERGYEMTTSAEGELVRDMKEKMCYVAIDYNDELAKAETSSSHCELEYLLPDGSKMTIGNQRFRAPELIFDPTLIKRNELSVQKITYNSIKNCQVDIRKDLYQNIVLNGGNTMYDGMVVRLTQEIINLAPKTVRIKVTGPPERKIGSWIGGSILSSLTTFQNRWMTKEEFDDRGISSIRRKFLGSVIYIPPEKRISLLVLDDDDGDLTERIEYVKRQFDDVGSKDSQLKISFENGKSMAPKMFLLWL